MSNRIQQAQNVLRITLVLNLVVALAKLMLGFATNMLSLIADGFHSLLDASANIVGLVGFQIAGKPADRNHPYGHQKFEAFAAILISFFLFMTSFKILEEAIGRWFYADNSLPEVTLLSYGVVLGAMIISYGVSRYEHRKGTELNSSLLVADSKHSLSDVYTSLSVICSLIAVQFDIYWVDIVASLFIVAMILKAGFTIVMDNLGQLVDEAVYDPAVIATIVSAMPEVKDCHKIRSRGTATHTFIDLHVLVDPTLTIKEAHAIAGEVKNKIVAELQQDNIVDVLVHVEEFEGPDAEQCQFPNQS
ncbi:MAG: cation diffusion facilitator family transporter [Vampirovibrio sp.]|nr:cation diffusion facilitator family transporter [Vampirovibrio sp.]